MRKIASSHCLAAACAAFACVIAFSACGNPAGGSEGSFQSNGTTSSQSSGTDLSSVVPHLANLSSGSTNVAFKPSFRWFSVDGATSYELYLSTESTAGSSPFASGIADTSYTPSNALSSMTTYYWKVVAKNASSASLPSELRSFTTDKSAGFAAPIYASPADGSSLYPASGFAWTSVAGATNYRFLCSTASDASGLIAWNEGTATSLAWNSYFFTPGYTWYWKIVAEDAASCSSDTSPVWSFTPRTDGIAAPANIAVDSSYRISWDAVTGAMGYAVLLNYGGTNFTKNSLAHFATTSLSFSAAYLSKGPTIGYTVVAIDSSGNTSYAESVAAAKTFIIQ